MDLLILEYYALVTYLPVLCSVTSSAELSAMWNVVGPAVIGPWSLCSILACYNHIYISLQYVLLVDRVSQVGLLLVPNIEYNYSKEVNVKLLN